MRFAVRVVMLCAGCALAGCGAAKKPYANDPLLRNNRAQWLSRDPARAQPPAVEPPQPPADPPKPVRRD